MDIVSNLVEKCTNLITTGGPLVGFLLILIESFIPALPLGVFVALNINAFGFLFGTVISWISTSLGSFLCYLLFCYLSKKVIYRLVNKKTKKKIQRNINRFKNISLQKLVLIITLPFTPSFLINILSGVAGIKKEKFLLAIGIGKIFVVMFWGYIGKSLIESMTDIKAIIFISLTLILAYILSKIIGKKMNIE